MERRRFHNFQSSVYRGRYIETGDEALDNRANSLIIALANLSLFNSTAGLLQQMQSEATDGPKKLSRYPKKAVEADKEIYLEKAKEAFSQACQNCQHHDCQIRDNFDLSFCSMFHFISIREQFVRMLKYRPNARCNDAIEGDQLELF